MSRPSRTRGKRAACAALAGSCLLVGLAVSACGDSAPSGPSPTAPLIQGVSPAAGSSFGGTPITISGQHFATGATLLIGGQPATDVTVQDAQTILAKTPPHSAGIVDLAVVEGGQRGALPAAFTYQVPSVNNTPPTIAGITVQGSQEPNEPSQFADLNEEVTVTASVQDPETAGEQLEYQWTADQGTFTGTGAAVKWRAPAAAKTPFSATLTLTVVEHYQVPDPTGFPVPKENRTTATTSVSVHDSVKEAGDVATTFLLDFSDSNVSPQTATRNFSHSPRCAAGAGEELSNVTDNRKFYHINSHDLGAPNVTFDYGGHCAYRNQPGDACIDMTCHWNSTIIDRSSPDFGKTEDVHGTCYLTAVYEQQSWLLCESNFQGTGTRSLKGFWGGREPR